MDRRELEELARLRREIAAIAAAPEPRARIVAPAGVRPGSIRRLAVLPGAFNPPTRAHLRLVEATRDLGFDLVAFCLGCVTLDKDDSGLVLEDRLWLLERVAASRPRLGVVVQNRSLYAEIAEVLHRELPGLVDLAFVAGMDKVPQLFDARYYEDPERSLSSLFRHARFLVAPRGRDGRAALDRLLSTAPARRFADRFEWLALDEELRELSATRVREALDSGRGTAGLLPPEVESFLERTGAFRSDGRYHRRAVRIAQLSGAAQSGTPRVQ